MDSVDYTLMWIADAIRAQDDAIKNNLNEGLIYEDQYITITRTGGKIIFKGKPMPPMFTYR